MGCLWGVATGPLPLIWGQLAGATPPQPVNNPAALSSLALRRWFGSLTLSSPDTVPGPRPLLTWLAGLAALALVVLIAQRPARAARQLFDLVGHARLVRDATQRLRRCGWMLALTIGATVLSWTGSQSPRYDASQGREDMVQLIRSRTLLEIGFEQGILAAATPLRDVAGLGSNLPLLALAVAVLFRATAESWGGQVERSPGVPAPRVARISPWATAGWVCGSLYIVYRLLALPGNVPELPPGGLLMIEAAVVPAVMLVADGILLAWILTELRNAGFAGTDRPANLPAETMLLMPGASLACALALPARYVATAVLLGLLHLPSSLREGALGDFLRFWGIANLQAAALVFAAIAGPVAWTRGSPRDALRDLGRMLASQGARVFLVLALGGVVAGLGSAVAYVVVLSLPTAPWVLAAADSYAHYLTLPVGLWTLSALVELAERALPAAELAPLEEPPPSSDR